MREIIRCCNSGTSPWLCGPGRSALHVVEWKHGRSLPHSLLHMRTSQAQQCYLIGWANTARGAAHFLREVID